MNELISEKSNDSTVKVSDFVARRYAQIFADLFKENPAQAELWTRTHIATEDRKVFQKYVIAELKKRKYTNIIPGGDGAA